MANIVVFGAGGRIGFPFSVYLAKQRHNVTGIELDPDYAFKLNSGRYVPFEEKGLKETMAEVSFGSKLKFITYSDVEDFHAAIKNSQHIIILVGTPANGTIGLDHRNIRQVFDTLRGYDLNGKNVYIRSTVEIGFTEKMDYYLKETSPGVRVIYWPERVIEGNALEEFDKIPHIVGYDGHETIGMYDILNKMNISIFTTTREAEFIKAATNTSRYVQFAFANELLMTAEKFGIDFNKIRDKMVYGYKRLDFLAYSGPNVGGPCLDKDWTVLDKYSSKMIRQASETNQKNILNFLVHRLNEHQLRNVLILGASFKRDSDDWRGSNIGKLTPLLSENGISFAVYDPSMDEEMKFRLMKSIKNFDGFVVFTPHSEFEGNNGLYKYIVDRAHPEAIVLNYWGSMAKVWQNFNNDSEIDIAGLRNNKRESYL